MVRSLDTAPPAEVDSLPEALTLAVLEAAVRARQPRLPEALSSSPRKAVAKAAKKSLYQLRSLGIAVPEKAPASSPPAPAATVEELPSLLSAVSGAGEQAIIVPRPIRGGLELLQFICSDERGMVDLTASDVGRSAYRRQLREIREGRSAPAVEIQRQEAVALLARASARNLASGVPYPKGSDEALRHLGVVAGPEESALPQPEPDDERLATQSAQLHAEPEMQPWLPPDDEIRALAAKAEHVTHSPLQLTDAQKSEQLIEVFRRAARDFFTPERQELYAQRLWSMASFFERTGRNQQAEIARAEARRLFHGPREPFSRFAEFLFEKVLWLSQRAQAGRTADAGQAPAPQASEVRGEHRSPGGLILP
jgi:hypothetical protein